MNMRRIPATRQAGFTLLELSLVLAIVAMVTGMGMLAGTGALESAKRTATDNKLTVIENALMAFRLTNGRLPCPGDRTLLSTNSSYGLEAANPGSCTGGTPAAVDSYSDATTGVGIREGVVPVKALNLPNDYMFDGWGRKFMYSIDKRVTAANAFPNLGLWEQCGLRIVDAAANNRTSGAAYVLLSYGANGDGAYTASGVKLDNGSVNSDERINFRYTGGGASYYHFVQKDETVNSSNPKDVFDDIVRYKTRAQLQASLEPKPIGAGICNASTRLATSSGDTYTSGYFGYGLATGDINGDDYSDLIISAPFADTFKGLIWVLFGSPSGFASPFNLSGVDGANGFSIAGFSNYTMGGMDVATGDINGDGIDDIIIGAPTAPGAYGGKAYVIFGKTTAWAATLDPTTLNGTNGFIVSGASVDRLAASVAAGDINNDGIKDVLMGSSNAAYAVFGHTGSWSSLDVASLNGTNGARMHVTEPVASQNVVGVKSGDINHDGTTDIIISSLSDVYQGTVWVLFGKKSWASTMELSTVNGMNGFSMSGPVASERLNATGTGDVNGDGITDVLLVSTPASYSFGVTASYGIYVLFGANKNWSSTVDLTALDGTNGFTVNSLGSEDGVTTGYIYLPNTLMAGDINGDGIGDLILGISNATVGGSSNAGMVYVMFGKKTWTAHVDFSTINGVNGFTVSGPQSEDRLGRSITTGRLLGNQAADLIIGAPLATAQGKSSGGRAYIVYGHRSLWQYLPSLPTGGT